MLSWMASRSVLTFDLRPASILILMSPRSVIDAVHPGSIRIVLKLSIIIAGPSITWPGARDFS